MPALLTPDQVRDALAVRDLTDPCAGPHALQPLLEAIERAMPVPVRRHRTTPVVTVADNYDRLGYPPGAAARDARHTRYLTAGLMLRAHTTAAMPALLERAAAQRPPDLVISCPGLCYRRDVIDRVHVGEPHQLDLWHLRTQGPPLTEPDLEAMIERVMAAAVPGRRWRTVPTTHPYTTAGRQIDVADGGRWVEAGECGLAHPRVLPARTTALAMGLGLDRLLMLRKGIDDIRLLRSPDPRVARQMLDLRPYTPVSAQPPIRRDLSLAVPAGTTPEQLGDTARHALGNDARLIEEITVTARTPYEDLPQVARDRLGIRPGQQNLLVRVVLRGVDRTLTAGQANRLRDLLHAALHHGPGSA